jgi:RES domain-containing protein
MDPLPARLSKATPVKVAGTWQRHVPARFASTGLQGRSAIGRWGTETGHPVLYLGKPTDSVTVEAYRHLIDPVVTDGGAAPSVRPRVLITCEVSVTNILDLRSAATRALSGLTLKQLQSDTSDKAAYVACQNVSAAAHQLEFHGLLAPAATKLGDTLVLFTGLLPAEEHPVGTSEEMWLQLPPDPRKPPRGK